MARAIVAEGIGKRYRLGEIATYDTLRESLSRRNKRDRDEGGFWALREIDFAVDDGEVLGIIGRNGAGKSTLLKILSRITWPTEGRALLMGRVGSLLEVGTGFHPELSGRENIFLNGSVLGMRRREIREKFDDIVDFAEISQFLDTPVKRYSSGMYVRLAFAVAAHLEPDILVVDEVLAVGDAEFQRKCLGRMDEVSQEGRTVLFVSHNMAAIRQLCSRAILLDHGRLLDDGPAEEVVGSYLQRVSSHGGGAQLDRPTGATAWVAGLGVGDTDHRDRDVFGMDEAIRFELLVTIESAERDLDVSLQVRDSHDQPVVHAPARDDNLSIPPVPGDHVVEAVFPSIGLYPDHYSVVVTLTEPLSGGTFTTHHKVQAASFTVEQTPSVTTRNLSTQAGRIHVPVSWQLLA